MASRRADAATHESLVGYLSDILAGWSWKVYRDPQVGTLRPDLIAEDPAGRAYIFEIKSGGYQGHLGALGQVETFKNAVQSELGREPTALLLLADEAPSELKEVASDVGVTLVGGFRDSRPALVELLKQALPDAGHGDLKRDESSGRRP
jgi:hypothetical protein